MHHIHSMYAWIAPNYRSDLIELSIIRKFDILVTNQIDLGCSGPGPSMTLTSHIYVAYCRVNAIRCLNTKNRGKHPNAVASGLSDPKRRDFEGLHLALYVAITPPHTSLIFRLLMLRCSSLVLAIYQASFFCLSSSHPIPFVCLIRPR